MYNVGPTPSTLVQHCTNAVADPECARGGGVSHILAEKRGVSFTLFKKMHENLIFFPNNGGGGGGGRPMLDPPLPMLYKYYTNVLCLLV